MNSFVKHSQFQHHFEDESLLVLLFEIDCHDRQTMDFKWLDYSRKIILKDGENCPIGRVYNSFLIAKNENMYFESKILEPLHAKFYFKNNKVIT
jgi:hypothetical protein